MGRDLIIVGEAATAWPVRVGALPLLADCFQSRDESVELGRVIEANGTAVLIGLGGVGKSQLAVEAARSWSDRVDVLVWVSATSREAILGAYADAARQLGRSGVHGPPEQAARGFLSWLQTTKRPWLVVLDDLVNPVDLRELWPDGSTGCTVVATRRTDAVLSAHGRRRIDVGLFTPAEARTYFGAKGLAADGTDELAADLGYLPLALAQAAAFMLDRGEDCVGYRSRLLDRRRALADLFPEQAVVDDYRATVAATWSISVEAADALTPTGLARTLLQALCTLDPNGFPAEIVETDAIVDLVSPAGTARDCRDALHNLARLSLVGLTRDPDLVGIHALVQRAASEGLAPERVRVLVRAAADALLAIWPDIERDRRLGQTLRTNTATLAGRSEPALWLPDAHQVLRQAGADLGQLGMEIEAIAYWKQMAEAATRILGPDHLSALAARSYLSCWRARGGAVNGAGRELNQLYNDYRRIVGEDHPDTLAAYGDLANCWGIGRGPTHAIGPLTKLLDAQSLTVGPNAPDRLCTEYNRAHWRGESGDFAGAVHELELLVFGLTEMCGLAINHPTVLMVRAARAHWLGEAGSFSRAIDELQRLLADHLQVLGADHLETLRTHAALADWRGRSGDRAGAADELQHLLADQVRVLGPDDPRLVQTRSDLTYWREGGPRRLNVWVSIDLTNEELQNRLRAPWSPQPLIGYQARAGWSASILTEGSKAYRWPVPVDSAWSNSVR